MGGEKEWEKGNVDLHFRLFLAPDLSFVLSGSHMLNKNEIKPWDLLFQGFNVLKNKATRTCEIKLKWNIVVGVRVK